MQESIVIRAVSKRNGWSFTLIGTIALVGAIVMFIVSSSLMGLGLACFVFGAIFTVLGVAKLMQPEVSVELRPQGLVYHHHRGSIYLEWDNIQRLDMPRNVQGFDNQELPYIGVRLKRLSPLIDDIPIRLATGLLTEQRPLLMSSLTLDGELADLERYLNSEFSPLTLEGKAYKGVQAMFSRRCEQLNSQFGYHVYIPVDCLDREPRDFLVLIRDYKQRMLVTQP
ncbi:DUF2982 domain-containing protein [Shewanella algidipiscicola]|uniref:DUF2982 domain-containing protein n=1 Tax=Shewanella algidipiscicola TaxID=614070 RepID=A0ABQ4PP61_9GAMM|nr:DUF2982 domain-containing protein [Shewanella algidipiscicola]GIU50197.1 hypothetical protein TUM4630_30590 [Shewanella algidipiscicola]